MDYVDTFCSLIGLVFLTSRNGAHFLCEMGGTLHTHVHMQISRDVAACPIHLITFWGSKILDYPWDYNFRS